MKKKIGAVVFGAYISIGSGASLVLLATLHSVSLAPGYRCAPAAFGQSDFFLA